MIVPGSANSLLLAQGAATGYNLTNSLRFRASASAYLNRTPSTTSGTQQYTISVWCKRGKLGSYQNILGSACPNPPFGNTNDGLRFNSSDQLEMLGRGGNDIYVVPSMVFRDPSAWYHIVVAVDTTQVTSSNRVKIYINGSQVTSFSSATYPTLGYTMLGFNVSGYANSIGSDPTNLGTSVCDSYMAEINVISGSQQAVTAFGANDATTGVWQPIKYTGTYGTNGYYLPFTDIATTSGSNAGLGKDFSGNGNYWNTNNISVSSGSTYDSMTDVPTLTDAITANYCVLNPVAPGDYFASGQSTLALTNGNLNYGSTGRNAFGSMAVSSGKWYWEFSNTSNTGSSSTLSGLVTVAPRASVYGVYYNSSNGNKGLGTLNTGATETSYGATWTDNDIIGVALNMDAATPTVTFYKNNSSQGAISVSSFVGQTVFAWMQNGANSNNMSGWFNFGQQPFVYTPPTGYVALNTYNLPTSTIVKGDTVMDATTYTGDGTSTRSITNTSGFKPDLVWFKSRTNPATGYFNTLSDSVRGFTSGFANVLYSNDTSTENTGTNTTGGGVSAFNSNGFSLTNGSGGQAFGNANTYPYVAWQWQAGQGTTSSNTNGSITSTVSVNATAGFSVVTYTGTGANATVGHGLGVAPKFIVIKDRDYTYNWINYHASLGSQGYLHLNTTDAAQYSSAIWNDTAPTSTVFSLGSANGNANTNGHKNVAYCWAEIAGFSKFGSYTGNGSADGPFIYTGFRPKFVMVKVTNSTSDWMILDSSRNTYNLTNARLFPDGSYAEDSSGNCDFVSNGFKWRGSNLGNTAENYIYVAFAENPFKNALAR